MALKRTPFLRKSTLGKKPRIPKGATTIERLLGEFPIHRASTFTAKPRPIKKRADSNKGWVDVARAKWDDPQNDHRCEVCGVFLGDDFSPAHHHHLLHRGSYRKFKRRPDNLAQLCVADHAKAHDFGIENLAQYGSLDFHNWIALYKRMAALRNEAHGIDPNNESTP
jgi:hypothetical protein